MARANLTAKRSHVESHPSLSMLIVTGGAGFIGSNLTHALAARAADVVVVDDLTDGTKCANLVGAAIVDYLDKDRLRTMMSSRDPWLSNVEAVFHLGACATTTKWNGRLMMENNFEYSKEVLSVLRNRPTSRSCTRPPHRSTEWGPCSRRTRRTRRPSTCTLTPNCSSTRSSVALSPSPAPRRRPALLQRVRTS